eukprot:TRINITY_DN1550_c0_g1_i2.p1 TRINITY_DN1550_c0_g1~~TRINITY_DN1550_c0_g1_i2.p1  ORF type:complete len:686 (+),score=139.26 TRINITY_DN1550_c0_g1_i2:35-2092(+)
MSKEKKSNASIKKAPLKKIEPEFTGARLSGLDPLGFSDVEREEFKDIPNSITLILKIRNHILNLWHDSPNVYLDLSAVNASLKQTKLMPTRPQTKSIPARIHEYLSRMGYINIGIFENRPDIIRDTPGGYRVIIVGGGISGVAATLHLQTLGYTVVLLEARTRLGGRIFTDKSWSKKDFEPIIDLTLDTPLISRRGDVPAVSELSAVEYGASVVTGLHGNPVTVLCKQLGLKLYSVREDCPIFDSNGKQVPEDVDEEVFEYFNKVMAQTSELRSILSPDEIHSLEEAIQRVTSDDVPHLKNNTPPPSSLLFPPLTGAVPEKIKEEKVTYEFKFLEEVPKENKRRSLDECVSESGLKKVKLSPKSERNSCKEEAVSERDHIKAGLFHWHLAHLEYGCSSDLSKVSLFDWDQDDVFELEGGHHLIPQGYSTIVEKMAEVVHDKVKLGCRVKRIEYGEKVKVHCARTDPVTSLKKNIYYEADYVLVTLPLGVLKKRTVEFKPPLPAWKEGAIDRMGFGALEKVVLLFDGPFWQKLPAVSSVDFFGMTASHVHDRGLFFFFWNLWSSSNRKIPALVALIAGKSAQQIENVDDASLVELALGALRKIFVSVPKPVRTHVTRWGSDVYTYGSYSFISVGSSGADYDLLAKSVNNQVFFAGEATSRQHPATVAGAFLSGLRAAADIHSLSSF